jgi:hypothetical protein
MQIFIFTLVVIFFALVLGFIARKRGADSFFWTVIGGLFGPFAVPFVFFAKSHDRQQPNSNQPEKTR